MANALVQREAIKPRAAGVWHLWANAQSHVSGFSSGLARMGCFSVERFGLPFPPSIHPLHEPIPDRS